MTPLPKRKFSSMRQGKRRASISLSGLNLIPCPNCGKPKSSHRVCPNCGQYKGRQFLQISTKESKKKE